MKKLILIIALLCISTSALAVEPIDFSKSYALSTAIQAVVGAGGAAAGGSFQSCKVDYSGAYNNLNYYTCSRFKALKTTTIVRADLYLQKTSAATGVDRVRIVTDKAGPLPTDTLATGDCTSSDVNRNDIPGSYAYVQFGGLSCGITADSYYWICKGDGSAYGAMIDWGATSNNAATGCVDGAYVHGDPWPPTDVISATYGLMYDLVE